MSEAIQPGLRQKVAEEIESWLCNSGSGLQEITEFFQAHKVGCVVKSPDYLLESFADGVQPSQEIYAMALNKLSVNRLLSADRLVIPIQEGEKVIGLFFVRSGIKIIV